MYKVKMSYAWFLRDMVSPDLSFRYKTKATCMLKILLWVDYVTSLYIKKYDCHAKMEICVFVTKIKKQRFSRLLSQTRPCDSNISVLYSSSFGLETTNVPSGNVNGKLTAFLCLSRPDPSDYPVPPLPTHATCNYAKSRDRPGKAHPSPPVEHEYHSIDVNYKRVTCATSPPQGPERTNDTMHPPADYKCVCLLFA